MGWVVTIFKSGYDSSYIFIFDKVMYQGFFTPCITGMSSKMNFQETWKCLFLFDSISGAVVFRYTADVDDTGNLHYLNAIKKSGRPKTPKKKTSKNFLKVSFFYSFGAFQNLRKQIHRNKLAARAILGLFRACMLASSGVLSIPIWVVVSKISSKLSPQTLKKWCNMWFNCVYVCGKNGWHKIHQLASKYYSL